MKKSRFSGAHNITAQQRQAPADQVQDFCRELGISEDPFYNWRAKFGA
jgi:hypothetical protein